jgi:hypothetical protein
MLPDSVFDSKLISYRFMIQSSFFENLARMPQEHDWQKDRARSWKRPSCAEELVEPHDAIDSVETGSNP